MIINKGFTAIILASGQSTRFQKNDKLLFVYKQKSLIYYCLETFLKVKQCSQIILVVNNNNFAAINKIVNKINKEQKIIIMKQNNKFRSDNVYEVLKIVKSKKVLIHDGARFNVSLKLIEDVYKNLSKYKAVVPYIKCTNTIAIQKNEMLIKKLNREKLVVCQTPQGFETSLLKKAMEKKYQEKLTDCASYLIGENISIKLILGDLKNIKITYPYDLKFLI